MRWFDGVRAKTAGDGRGRGRIVAARLEAVSWVAAGALLGSAAWMKVDALWYQHRAGAELAAESAAAPVAASRPRGEAAPAPPIAIGTPLARLTIPRLDLSVVVAEGVTDQVLRRAVGHVPESAPIGGAGNVALAGHRDTFFRPLERIRVDDRIVLESPQGGRSAYRVEWAALVEPRQVDLLAASGYSSLTLVTCYPFEYVGSAPYRFVVRARREGTAAVSTLRAAG